MKNLEAFNKPGRLEMEDENNIFCFFVPEIPDEEDDTPTTLQEAWHHRNMKWREAIRLKFRQMLKHEVWRKQGLNQMPWNRNGVFRTRLVAKGYDQISGVDFQYNVAPITIKVSCALC